MRSSTYIMERSEGDSLVCFVDEPDTGDVVGEIVIAPPFGVTADGMFPFAYTYVLNGFRVHRLDYTDHVGLSSGVIEDATLTGQLVDLKAVVERVPSPIIMSMSLSCRPALRLLAEGAAPVLGGVLVTPVVDVRSTLAEVLGDDYLSMAVDDMPDHIEVFAYVVKQRFAIDAINNRFSDLAGAVADAQRLSCPVSFIAGDADDWVSIDSVGVVAEAARGAGVDARLTAIPAAMHRINRNPAVAARYIETSARECLRLAGVDVETAVMPTFNDMLTARAESRKQQRVADLEEALP